MINFQVLKFFFTITNLPGLYRSGKRFIIREDLSSRSFSSNVYNYYLVYTRDPLYRAKGLKDKSLKMRSSSTN